MALPFSVLSVTLVLSFSLLLLKDLVQVSCTPATLPDPSPVLVPPLCLAEHMPQGAGLRHLLTGLSGGPGAPFGWARVLLTPKSLHPNGAGHILAAQ